MRDEKIKGTIEAARECYYALPLYLFFIDSLLVVSAYAESKLRRSVLMLLSDNRLYDTYKYGGLMCSSLILGLCVAYSWMVWNMSVHKVVLRNIEKCLLNIAWTALSLFYCIPLSMGFLCAWSFQAICISIGRIVLAGLIVANVCVVWLFFSYKIGSNIKQYQHFNTNNKKEI